MENNPFEELLAPPRRSSSFPIKPLVLGSLFVFIFGLGMSGLIALKNQLYRSLSENAAGFRYLVLSDGNRMEIDEVGRLLQQLDGVEQAVFVTPEEALAQLKSEGIFSSELEEIDQAMIPSSWQIKWRMEAITHQLGEDVLSDILKLPGVRGYFFCTRSMTQARIRSSPKFPKP